MKRSLPLLVLLLAACGNAPGNQPANSGNDTPANQPTNRAKPAPVESPELTELHRIAGEAADKYPNLVDWEGAVDARITLTDGRVPFGDAGSIANNMRSSHFKDEEVEWRFLLNDHFESFEEQFGRAPYDREREIALGMCDQIPALLSQVARCKSLVVFGPLARNGAKSDIKTSPLVSAAALTEVTLHRAWLLADLKQEGNARRELVTLIQVLSLLDVDTCLLSHSSGLGVYGKLILGLLKGPHPEIAASTEVSKAVTSLGVHLLQSTKQAWRMEFSWEIGQGLHADEGYSYFAGDPPESMGVLAQLLRHDRELADMFSGGPDFSSANDRHRALAHADGLKDPEAARNIVRWVDLDAHLAVYCLAWELFCEDRKQPLVDRKQFAIQKVTELPEAKAVWSDQLLEIGFDEKSPLMQHFFKGFGMEEKFLPLATIDLQPSEE